MDLSTKKGLCPDNCSQQHFENVSHTERQPKKLKSNLHQNTYYLVNKEDLYVCNVKRKAQYFRKKKCFQKGSVMFILEKQPNRAIICL